MRTQYSSDITFFFRVTEIPTNTRETLKDTLFNFLNRLPEDNTTQRIKEKAMQIFQSKDSLFGKIKEGFKI